MLAELAAKARLTEQVFNEAPGIRCNPVQGAMYSFPSMQLPPRAVQCAQVLEARRVGRGPWGRGGGPGLPRPDRRPRPLPRSWAWLLTCSSACASWRRPASAWCQAAASGSGRAPTTSGEPRQRSPSPRPRPRFAYFSPPFRMTILPPMDKLRSLLEKLSQFHAKFTREYS